MVDVIVGRAMEKDPRRRYQSAADFAADLRACLEQPDMPAPHPPALDFELEGDAASVPVPAPRPASALFPALAAAPAPATDPVALSRRFDSADGLEHLAALAAAGRDADGAPPMRERLNEDPLLAKLAAGAALAALAALMVALA
jgi:hypothetical protein